MTLFPTPHTRHVLVVSQLNPTLYSRPLNSMRGGHRRKIFSEGAKSFFLIFVSTSNAFCRYKISILVDPKQISVVLKSEKQKNKNKNKNKQTEKTKKKSPHFVTFPPSIFNFPPSLLQFSFFSSPFSLFSSPFSLALLFPIDQQRFPGPPTCYATEWGVRLGVKKL